MAFGANVLVLDYEPGWMDRMGLEGPPGGVFFALSILFGGAVMGLCGFLWTLNRLRRNSNTARDAKITL
jgi:hypothetical protein